MVDKIDWVTQEINKSSIAAAQPYSIHQPNQRATCICMGKHAGRLASGDVVVQRRRCVLWPCGAAGARGRRCSEDCGVDLERGDGNQVASRRGKHWRPGGVRCRRAGLEMWRRLTLGHDISPLVVGRWRKKGMDGKLRGGRKKGNFIFLPLFTWYLYDLPSITLQ
jgi:hypothetical protein